MHLPRPTLQGLALTAAFVLVSSVLGLTGRFLLFTGPLGGFGGPLAFFVAVWSASLLADVVFVATSAAAAWIAFGLARDEGPLPSVVASFTLNWGAYWVSYQFLNGAGFSVHDAGPFESLWFVGVWGAVGLVFAAIAPAAGARFLR